jgi:hypothetical protein
MSRRLLQALFLSILAALPLRALAQEAGPLCYQVYKNGTVIVSDGPKEIVRIFPHLFAGGPFYFRQVPSPRMEDSFLFTPFPKGKKHGDYDATANVHGGEVDLSYRVERLSFGLRIHYTLEPRINIQLGRVQVYTRFDHADWKNAPLSFNDNEGYVPDLPKGDSLWGFILRSAYSSPISLGPSPALGGLAFQMSSKGLYTELVGNERWGRSLGIVYSRHEFSFPQTREPVHLFYKEWIWEQGVEKNFDFDITFNRPMAPSPCITVTPGVVGNKAAFAPKPEIPTNPVRVLTATPLATATRTATLIPTPTRTATPTASPTPTWTPRPIPPPARVLPRVIAPRPTATPVPVRSTPTVKVQARSIRVRPTPNRGWRPTFTRTSTPRPLPVRKAISKAAWTPTPTPIPSWLPKLDKANAIVFSETPPNIYVSFADGPGVYRLQIVDNRGNLLQVIYNQRVVTQADAWVGWDGKDAQGRVAPPGQYFVIIYKDGKALKSLSVVRTASSR